MALAVALTANTPLAPRRYERQLLDCYVQGTLTIDRVLELLAASVYQVVYRSRVAGLMPESALRELVEYSRAYNAAHGITGLLLHSSDRFAQVLEGEEQGVRELYARIQHDVRHLQVVTVSEGPEPGRRFPDWSMGFGYVSDEEADQVLAALEATGPASGFTPDDPKLRALLQAFGIR